MVSLESATAPLVAFHDGGQSLLGPADEMGALLAEGLEPGATPGVPFRLIEDDETWDTAEQAATSAWDARRRRRDPCPPAGDAQRHHRAPPSRHTAIVMTAAAASATSA